MERKFPIYILIDTSGSMKGEPIEAVNVGLESMLAALRTDPNSLESAAVSIITFDNEVKVVLPLTPVDQIQLPRITTPEYGATHTGQALKTLLERMRTEVRRNTPDSKGDWMPLLFLLTDGKASDLQLYNEECRKVREAGFADVVACAAGMKADKSQLKQLTDNVLSLDTLDSRSFVKFFTLVSQSAAAGNRSAVTETSQFLPPPPEEISIV